MRQDKQQVQVFILWELNMFREERKSNRCRVVLHLVCLSEILIVAGLLFVGSLFGLRVVLPGLPPAKHMYLGKSIWLKPSIASSLW